MKTSARFMPVEDDYIAFKNLLKTYQFAIRSLIYAMLDIKPDIVFAVSMVFRYVINSTDAHHFMIKRIFRYLRAIVNWHLIYQGSLKDFIGYTDFD